MNKETIITTAKFVGTLITGAVVGATMLPAVKKFFKLDKEKIDTVPSEDIAEEEITEE